ncbi:MAG TPA: chain length determinant protein EpsF [Rhizobacter sp.]|nr:chain length determinant protein EpsF [Rhizobacter sp.]
MSLMQYLRVVWARKWLALVLLVVVGALGTVWAVRLPKRYTAQSSLVVEIRVDPVLGAMAPSLSSPAYLATQLEILKSDRVSSRVVKLLGIEESPAAIQQWREATKGKIPMDRYFGELLEIGLSVEPGRGSNLIFITFASKDPAFAAAAANAFAQAYMDVSVELRVEPAKQSAAFLDTQSKVLRTNLEQSQAKLSKYQQDKGIVVSDERVNQENQRLNELMAQLTLAQAANVDASSRQINSGGDSSPDVLQSSAVQSLKSQLAAAETKLSEISSVVGVNHPQRIQLTAQITELKQQLASEVRRVSGGSSVASRATSQKVNELRALAEVQKRQVLSLRSERDQISVLQRDVETAQRAYESVSQRVNQLNLEGQNNQANVRILSPATEPSDPTRSKVMLFIIASLIGGLVLGAGAAIGLELLDRRVRSVDDMDVMDGVPVIGILRPEGSKQPVFRRLMMNKPTPNNRPLLSAPGARP